MECECQIRSTRAEFRNIMPKQKKTSPAIFSTHPLHPQATAMLKRHGEVVVASAIDPVTLADEAREADIVIVRANLPPVLFERAKKLRAAIRHGAGLDMIPIGAATRAGVLVANVPGANARTVAEHVLWTSMALLRKFRQVDRDLRHKGWLAGRDHAASGNDLSGRTMGIVGFGAVGRHVADIAAMGFGLDVVVNSRTPRDLPGHVRFASVDELVEKSDIIVLCCPLTLETTGMIGRDRIRRGADRGAVLRTGRGRRARRLRDAAAAAGPSLFRLRQCDHHAAHGRDHRGEHDAHGAGCCRGGDPRAQWRFAAQSAQPGGSRTLSPALSVKPRPAPACSDSSP
jgi:D-3-phosphoglycerate dehydrogenase